MQIKYILESEMIEWSLLNEEPYTDRIKKLILLNLFADLFDKDFWEILTKLICK